MEIEILLGVTLGILFLIVLYGFIVPQIRLRWRKRTADDQFHPDELTSIQSGLREFEVGQIEFEYPDMAASRLEEIWQFDQSGLPTAREEEVEVVDKPDWLAELRSVQPGDAVAGVPKEADSLDLELLGESAGLDALGEFDVREGVEDEKIATDFREPEWFVGMSHEFTKSIKGKGIDRKLKGRILEAISYVGSKPTVRKGDTVKSLTGDLKGLWRYRIGDYRLVYRPDVQKRQVVLVTFASRGSVYS